MVPIRFTGTPVIYLTTHKALMINNQIFNYTLHKQVSLSKNQKIKGKQSENEPDLLNHDTPNLAV